LAQSVYRSSAQCGERHLAQEHHRCWRQIGDGHCAGVLGGTMRNRYSALLNQSKTPAVTEPDCSNEFDDAKKLSEADQEKVDAFLKRGVNSVERKPFKPLFLVFLLMAVVAAFSLLSQGIAQWAGIY
jgi:hypothetical protein